ncbi:MAG: alpha/beta hydrolase [Rhizobiaceae bacterium]|nr:alpha/beta hydrolase [Rhizobiaceae bacterium]
MSVSRRQFTTGLIAAPAIISSAGLVGNAHAAIKSTHRYGSNQLDWYPARRGSPNAPILIYVHGGAWALGNRGQVHSKPKHFTSNGYHFVSVTYTLFPAANAQTQALQVGEAVNWVHANASRFGADPERIALMGHSAGCHLSSLATLTGAAQPVKALICNDTRAYDLPFLARISGGGLPALYAPAFSNRKMWDAWSPISYSGLKEQPPTLVAWSNGRGRDKVSKRFADTLEYDGTNVTRYDGKRKYNHFSIDRRMGRERAGLTTAIDGFLQEKIGA